MADEPFTLISMPSTPSVNPSPQGGGPFPQLFPKTLAVTSGLTADHDLQHLAHLRTLFPEQITTSIPTSNIPLRAFASAGLATCVLDTSTDSYASWRGYNRPLNRKQPGSLAESVHFAKYHYQWNGEDFILFTIGNVQYVLKEIRPGESALGPSQITDDLIRTVGEWQLADRQVVWVYDRYWAQSKDLYQQIARATWDKVILDEAQKHELTSVANKFFSSKQVYEDLGVPWKRGLLFHGPPGNGKTVSIKALMHTLWLDRGGDAIPTLYVKNAPMTYDIQAVFRQARLLSPCMVVLEDVETIVTAQTRSYFFNEMDGLENNDGLFIVASTNFLDRLDTGLSKRPSRFDRKYLFPLPNERERTLYCEFWRHKLEEKPSIDFPEKLSPAMAHITKDFSFAFLQECFVSTLLIMARDEGVITEEKGDDDLDQYELWRVFKKQADLLRKEIHNDDDKGKSLATSTVPMVYEDVVHPTPGRKSGDSKGHGIDDMTDLLPQLPYVHDKKQYLNTTAFMMQ